MSSARGTTLWKSDFCGFVSFAVGPRSPRQGTSKLGRAGGRPMAGLTPALMALALAGSLSGLAHAATTVPGGTLSSNATWTAAGSPYIVQGTLAIGSGAALTVEPGVQVRFVIGTALDIAPGGALAAEGSAAQPIVFTSDAATPQKGDWYYLRAQAGARMSLTHCEIAHAGRGGYSALPIYGSDVTVRSCRIHDNYSRAVHLEGAGLAPVIEDTRIENNGEIAIYQATIDMTPTYRRLSLSGNGTNSLVIPGGTVTRAVSLDGSTAALTTGTLAITGSTIIAAGGALSLTPGTTVNQAVNTEISIQSGGALDALGTALAPIAFASTQAGDWYFIRAYSGSHLRLEHCDLAHAGRGNNAALLLYNTDAVIADSRIHHNYGRGVYIEGAGLTPSFSDTQIDHNGGEAIYQSTINMAPSYSNLTFNDNGVNSLVIANNTVTSAVTLDGSASRFNGQPIRLYSNLVVNNGATLDIAAGTTLRLAVSGEIDVAAGGSLVATGTAGAPIVLTSTSATSTPGEWFFLRAYAGAHVDLDYCDLTSAGRGNNGAMLLYTSDANLSHCRIHDNQWHGITLDGAGLTPAIGDTRIDHNGAYALYQTTINMAPAYANLTLDGNGTDALVIGSSTVTSAVTLEATPATLDGKSIIPLSSIVVNGGGSLTIKAGTTIKLPISSELTVNPQGTLKVEGSQAAPVMLTSSAAAPARGDWYFVRANADSTVNLAYCDITAAGRGHNGAVLLYSSGVTISHCRIHDNQWHGIDLEGAGLAPVIGDTQIDHNGAYALYQNTINMAPAYANLDLTDNGTDALVIGNSDTTTAATLAAPAATIGGKPIILLSSINIRTGASLTIGAGATIKLPVSAVIDVLDGGTLVAEGSDTAPIVLTSNTATPATGDWYFVRGYAGSHLRLSFCEITAAGRGNSAAVLVATTDAALSHCRIHGNQWDGLSATGTASPRLTNNHIYGNAFGVRNSGTQSWVDARLTWWGDASGPYHPTLNPNGKGNAVSDKVLFVPWAEDSSGTTLSQIYLQVVGPSRVSPGETVDYAVGYYAGQAVSEAVLVLAPPMGTSVLSSIGGGVYWPELRHVFWKLGDLPAGSEGTVAARVRFDWGLPSGASAGALAVLGGANIPVEGFDLDAYASYEPETVISRIALSEAELAAERAASPDLDALIGEAIGSGFQVSAGWWLTDSAGHRTIRIALLRRGAFMFVDRDADVVLAHSADAISQTIQDAHGGMTTANESGAVDYLGSWSSQASALRATPPALTIGQCMRNWVLVSASKLWLADDAARVLPVLETPVCWECWAGLKASCSQCSEAIYTGQGGKLSTFYAFCKEGTGYACTGDLRMCEPTNTFIRRVSFRKALSVPRVYPCMGGVYGSPVTGAECPPGTECVNRKAWYGENLALGDCVGCTSGSPAPIAPQALAAPAFADKDASRGCARLAAGGAGCSRLPTVVRVARDPNAKLGPAGDLVPGQTVSYTITYENEGQGRAFGVYILDRLGPHFDETTLTTTGRATFIPATRELLWDVGELAPKGESGSKGEVAFTVRLRPTLLAGTVVENHAVVYFPSVPEETPTNGVVNVVQPVAAVPQSVTATSMLPVNIVLSGVDPTGAPLLHSVAEQPFGGTLTGVPPSLTYTAAANFSGHDRFTFKVSNGVDESRPAEVSITVNPSLLDSTPPQVVWTYPAPGATVSDILPRPLLRDDSGPVYSPSVLVQLSEAADPESVSSHTVKLADSSGRECTASVALDDVANQIIVTMREPWRRDTYEVSVGAGVTDAAGNHLAAPHAWSFTADPLSLLRRRLYSQP